MRIKMAQSTRQGIIASVLTFILLAGIDFVGSFDLVKP